MLAAIAARVAMHREHGIAHLAGAAAFSGVLFAALGVVTVVANLGAARWQDADGVGIPLALACCGLAWLVAALVSRAARMLERTPTIGALARPTVGLGATERAVWTAGAKNRVLFVIALLVAIGGVVTWAGGAGWVTFVSCIAVAIAVTALAEAHVRVDERALTIAFGPIGLPRIRIAVDRIAHAETMTVQPMANGGWGYRGSLTALGRAAVVIRGGEGLRLALRDNKTLDRHGRRCRDRGWLDQRPRRTPRRLVARCDRVMLQQLLLRERVIVDRGFVERAGEVRAFAVCAEEHR